MMVARQLVLLSGMVCALVRCRPRTSPPPAARVPPPHSAPPGSRPRDVLPPAGVLCVPPNPDERGIFFFVGNFTSFMFILHVTRWMVFSVAIELWKIYFS